MRPCICIRGSVCPSVRPSTGPLCDFKNRQNETIRGGPPSNTFLTIYNNNNDDNVGDDNNSNNNDDNAGEMGRLGGAGVAMDNYALVVAILGHSASFIPRMRYSLCITN